MDAVTVTPCRWRLSPLQLSQQLQEMPRCLQGQVHLQYNPVKGNKRGEEKREGMRAACTVEPGL